MIINLSHYSRAMFTVACKRGGRRRRTGRGAPDENPDEEQIALQQQQQQQQQASTGSSDAAKGLIAPAVLLGVMGAAKVGSALYERYKNKKSESSLSPTGTSKATPATAAPRPSKIPVPTARPSSLNATSTKTKTSIPAPSKIPTLKTTSLLSRIKSPSILPSRLTSGIRTLRGRGAIKDNIKRRQRQHVVSSMWTSQRHQPPSIREILSSASFQTPASADTLHQHARKANVIALSRVIRSLGNVE